MSILRLGVLLLLSTAGFAFSWKDLWQTPNQQGQALMLKQQYSQAQKTFTDSNWQAVAAYRAGDYQQAQFLFEKMGGVDGFFNQGNALAWLGQYDKAILAYDKALALDPHHQDAQYNRSLIEQLLKKASPEEQQKAQKESQSQKAAQNQNASQNTPSSEASAQPSQSKEQDKTSKQQTAQSVNPISQKSLDPKTQSSAHHDAQKKGEPSTNSVQNTTDKALKETQVKASQEASERWLQLIPDEPGELLQQKFLRDHLRRSGGYSP